MTKAQLSGTVLFVSAHHPEAARIRWSGSTEAERRAATEPARKAELQRRRTATRVLDALLAAGVRVELTDDREDAP